MTRTKAKAKQAESETVQEVAPDAAAPELVVTSIKGFSADWTCRGFQFEFGKTYEVSGPIKACENGFHACPTDEHPLSVFEYYASAGSRFAEVTQAGASDKQGNKLASAEITIGVEVSISDLVARAFKWVWDRATLVEGSSATGDRGAACATGVRGAASASGYSGAASATGYSGAASATGDSGAASATGKHSVAMAVGVYARAMAGETSCICLAHRDPETDVIIAIRASKVGENGVKAGVWYSLNAAGEFIEESAS
ncbi:DUF7666 domain-containing protein [Rhodoblastus sp.]|uniref:DUF7666 domain-containing protein n=1 Tax=Rhodoblastus sp. TaxID=1962975 RepID=UPI003F9D531D